MRNLSLDEALHLIDTEQAFEALVEGSFQLKVDAYLPVVATAIHAGSALRQELSGKMLLTDEERYYEEDPATDAMIASQPITLVGCDSRFEYDLNRPRALSTYYKSAWSKQVWKRALNDKQRAISQKKHQAFYRLFDALIDKLENLHRHVLVYDIHSYNHQRIDRATPTFNLGTAQIDLERWGPVVTRFCRELGKIRLEGKAAEARLNDVFEGRGYLIAHTNARFDRTLVLPTEVKKVYMNEGDGTLFPSVIEALSVGMKEAFSETAALFHRQYNRRPRASKTQMLSPEIEPAVLSLDKALCQLGKGMETLPYLNPVNLDQEKRRFLESHGRHQPKFRYKPLTLEPFAFKEKLFALPFDEVKDPEVKRLYQDVADNLSRRVDMLTSVGLEEFRYASLRYYGKPDDTDLQRARFLLQAAALSPSGSNADLDSAAAATQLEQMMERMGLDGKVSLCGNLAAKAMVISGKSKPQLLLNRYRSFQQQELEALRVHELGVHMATTLNGRGQPLKVLNLGLPGNTQTQEGLAILAEFCAGALPLSRLKSLGARVIAVESMLVDNHFGTTWERLRDEAHLNDSDAFDLCARVYRAGGLTKDFQYLTGFTKVLALAQQRDLSPLLCGKTSLAYLDLLEELCSRGWLNRPKPVISLDQGEDQDPILSYLIQSLAPAA